MNARTTISHEDFVKVVTLFFETVDGGCVSCAEDATECLMQVLAAEFNWRESFEEVKAKRWLSNP